MTKFDWFDEATEAITAVAKQPAFPGDEPPVKGYLEKFLNRAFSECHNGGELGKDECPVCRALRTEKAERLTDEYAKVVESQLEEIGELGEKVVGLEVDLDTARSEVEGLKVAVSSLRVLSDDWMNRFNKAHAAELSLLEKVHTQAETLSQLQRVNIDQGEQVRVLEERVKKMKGVVKELVEA